MSNNYRHFFLSQGEALSTTSNGNNGANIALSNGGFVHSTLMSTPMAHDIIHCNGDNNASSSHKLDASDLVSIRANGRTNNKHQIQINNCHSQPLSSKIGKQQQQHHNKYATNCVTSDLTQSHHSSVNCDLMDSRHIGLPEHYNFSARHQQANLERQKLQNGSHNHSVSGMRSECLINSQQQQTRSWSHRGAEDISDKLAGMKINRNDEHLIDTRTKMHPMRASQTCDSDCDQYSLQLRKNQYNQLQYNIGNSQTNHTALRYSQESKSSPVVITSLNNERGGPTEKEDNPISGSHTSKADRDEKSNQRSHHVNFNRRFGQANASDEDEASETRKKKYLTAKYGQQQMNLIKKRLKVEAWLHDQLQELAKQCGTCEDKVDDIDIDLDYLLDLEHDEARRGWLREILEPLDSLSNESINKFIDDVLSQSKLL